MTPYQLGLQAGNAVKVASPYTNAGIGALIGGGAGALSYASLSPEDRKRTSVWKRTLIGAGGGAVLGGVGEALYGDSPSARSEPARSRSTATSRREYELSGTDANGKVVPANSQPASSSKPQNGMDEFRKRTQRSWIARHRNSLDPVDSTWLSRNGYLLDPGDPGVSTGSELR